MLTRSNVLGFCLGRLEPAYGNCLAVLVALLIVISIVDDSRYYKDCRTIAQSNEARWLPVSVQVWSRWIERFLLKHHGSEGRKSIKIAPKTA